MIKKTLIVTPKLGMHARPAGAFVRLASGFKSEIMVSKDGSEVNGKSIMQMLLVSAECGAQINLRITGPDEKEALADIEQLFKEFAKTAHETDYMKAEDDAMKAFEAYLIQTRANRK